MRKVSSEIISGVAIFFALVIFIGGYLFLKNVALATDRYTVTIHFQDVTGLEKSDFVSVSGLRIGRVARLRLNGLSVLVDVKIEPGLELPVDSRAQIKSLGMVGEKFIDIMPGKSDQMLADGDEIQGLHAGDISDLGGSMEDLLKQAQQFLDELQSIIHTVFDSDTQRDLKESLYHLRNLSSGLDNNLIHMNRTLANLDSLSTNLADRREKVGTSIDNFYAASNRLEDFTNKLDNSLTSMQTLLTKIENKEGALGKVISSDELYNDIRHLTAELDTLVQDLKRRPQKYLNLGFIKVF
jgi:phospholipid/cholesterol/gamma-HCH transport system substrate-binding protein